MPSLGFDMTEGKVARWTVKEGEQVKRDQVIGEIETEKATVDLIATTAGVLKKILVEAGNTVPVNTPIAIIAAPDEKVDQDGGTDLEEQEREQEEAPGSSQEGPAQVPEAKAKAAPAPSDGDGRIKVSPVARNMAKEHEIDLTAIKGTGPGGRIIERDVQAAIDAVNVTPALQPKAAPAAPAAKPAAPPPAPKPAPTPPPAPMPVGQEPQVAVGEKPLSKMRQTIARRLLESKTTIPHYYLTIEVLMGEAMKLREQLNAMAGNDNEKLSVNDLIIAAAGRTLRQFPNVNGYFKGDRIELHDHINIGVAVAVEDGLLTPVLHNVDQKSLKQIASETKGLAERARANRMKPEDLGPGTFTISNLGMFGIEEFAAIINPPESAILAVGVVKKVPVVMNDSIQIAQVMKVTLSADHRIVDGALGARFLQELKKLLENPVNLLLG